MSAVVEFVEDVVGGVVDAVGDVVEAVADVVTVVADKVADTVRAVVADPLPTILAIGGQMIGIPAPLTMGAITAARGGDLEDVILSAGTAYLAPAAGNALSSTFSTALVDVGVNQAFSDVIGSSVSKGLVNGTIAEIKGGDFDDGFAGGFTGGMVSGGVSEVSNYVKPEVIQMAQDNGFDLKDANAAFNATQRAVSSGISAEITGKNDFATAFTNSAIGSSVDYGTNALNKTIDEQFKSTATDWNQKDKENNPIDVAVTGAGIPNELVDQVKVSDIGADSKPAEEVPQVADVPQVAAAPTVEASLANAPKAQELSDFVDLNSPKIDEPVLGQPENLAGAETQPPIGGLTTASDVLAAPNVGEEPVATPAAPVISEEPIAQNLTTAGIAPEEPQGGLNAVSEKPPEQKMAESQGLKATDITKPLVATAGNIFKSALTQRKPAARPSAQIPAGGLQAARPMNRPPPPQKMDVAKLIPIQRTASLPPPPTKRVAPAQRLDSTAKLTPIQNIAGLTSMVKRTG
jgi:hypothetical protein